VLRFSVADAQQAFDGVEHVTTERLDDSFVIE
jgi:hypothetical protein